MRSILIAVLVLAIACALAGYRLLRRPAATASTVAAAVAPGPLAGPSAVERPSPVAQRETERDAVSGDRVPDRPEAREAPSSEELVRLLGALEDFETDPAGWMSPRSFFALDAVDLRRLEELVRELGVDPATLRAAAEGLPADAPGAVPLILGMAFAGPLSDEDRSYLLASAALAPDSFVHEGQGLARSAAALHTLRLQEEEEALRGAVARIARGLTSIPSQDFEFATNAILRVAMEGMRTEGLDGPELDLVLQQLTGGDYRAMSLTTDAWSLAARVGGPRWRARVMEAALAGDGHARAAFADFAEPSLAPELAALLATESPTVGESYAVGSAGLGLLSIGSQTSMDALLRELGKDDGTSPAAYLIRALREDGGDPAHLGAMLEVRAATHGRADPELGQRIDERVEEIDRRLSFRNYGPHERRAALESLRTSLERIPAGSHEELRVLELLARHGTPDDRALVRRRLPELEDPGGIPAALAGKR